MVATRPCLLDDVNSLTMESLGSWSYGFNGTMCHRETGMRVSSDKGIAFEGREYQFSEKDVDIDRDSYLGAGACGTVRRGTIHKTGGAVAVKTLRVDCREERELLLNEVRALVQAEGCPNLAQWHAGFVGARGGQVHLVLELMDLGSLADVRKRLPSSSLPPAVLARTALQVARGVAHLHARRLLHRDIKPENILLNTSGEVKVSDFGLTKALDASLPISCMGTKIYLAPEKCMSGADDPYGLPSDIWSVGMVFYELASGAHPFRSARSFPEIAKMLLEKPEPRLLESEGHPAPLCSFVARCLIREVCDRADAQDLLGHPFLDEDDGEMVSQQELSAWLQDQFARRHCQDYVVRVLARAIRREGEQM